MVVRVAINGYGRIGRLTHRAMVESGRTDIELVAINDLGSPSANAHLLKYDSVHGRFNADIKADETSITVNGHSVKVFAEKDPLNLPWKELDIDVVMECTGLFTSKEKASLHLQAGAKQVLVSAPAKGADKTIVFGVNQNTLTKDDLVVSNASCTTNCLAPVAYVLNKKFGITRGYMTTIHSYTGDQRTLDIVHLKDPYRGRAAALSMIPTSTGAAKAVGLVLPELAGKLDGSAVRVPTPNVSLVDLCCDMNVNVTAEEVNAAIKEAAEGELKGTLAYNEEPLVSSDFNGIADTSIFDATQTKVIDGNFLRIVSWYDNEWGFSNKMSDTAVAMAKAFRG